jgi:hypothetical protein
MAMNIKRTLAAFVRSGCDATAFIPVGVKVTQDPEGCAQIDHKRDYIGC